jgi:MFS transporter, ACS family, DAL5 transporter family protein
MILEGVPTFVLGIASFFFLADNPSKATYLTPPEREFLRLRRLREQGESTNAQKFHWEDVRKTFLDWRMIAFAIAQFGVDTMVAFFSLFSLANRSAHSPIVCIALWV